MQFVDYDRRDKRVAFNATGFRDGMWSDRAIIPGVVKAEVMRSRSRNPYSRAGRSIQIVICVRNVAIPAGTYSDLPVSYE